MANYPFEHAEHGGGASTSTSSVHVNTRESGAGKKKKKTKTKQNKGEQRRDPPHTVVTHCTTPGSSEERRGEEGGGRARYATRNTKSVFVISDDKKSRRDAKANGAKQSVYSYSGCLVGLAGGGGASVVVRRL